MSGVIIKERRLAAQNSRWRVYFDHLIDDKGNEVPDYLVLDTHHPRADRISGVDILPVIGNKLVLVRVYRHALGRELWEVPRGFIDEPETAAEAALRELTEETGLHCAVRDLVALGAYAPEPGTIAACAGLFAATRCEGSMRPATDELGLGALALFDRTEVTELIAAGEIAHSGTLILFYRFCELQR